MPMDLLSKAAMSIRSSLTKEFCFWHIPEMPPAAIDGRLLCPIGLWQSAQHNA